jgi:hypothetical protein
MKLVLVTTRLCAVNAAFISLAHATTIETGTFTGTVASGSDILGLFSAVENTPRAVNHFTARQRRLRHSGSIETGDDTMRPYATVIGMAFGLLAVWGVLVQFVA